MVKAVWKGKIIAESNRTEMVEGNHYFPPDSINKGLLRKSSHHTICPWKGKASYYDAVVDNETNENAAWYYPEPKEAAKNIKSYVAFWNGVEIEE